MIYLKNISDPQIVKIPRNGEILTGGVVLVVRNTTDKNSVSLSVSNVTTSELYFTMSVVIPEGFTDGEYQYQLTEGENVLSCGLMIVGELETPSEYQKTITYEQYESE